MKNQLLTLTILTCISITSVASYEEAPSCIKAQALILQKTPAYDELETLKNACSQELGTAPTTRLSKLIKEYDLNAGLKVTSSKRREKLALIEKRVNSLISDNLKKDSASKISSTYIDQSIAKLNQITADYNLIIQESSQKSAKDSSTEYFPASLVSVLAKIEELRPNLRSDSGIRIYKSFQNKLQENLNNLDSSAKENSKQIGAVLELTKNKLTAMKSYSNFNETNDLKNEILASVSGDVAVLSADMYWIKFLNSNHLSHLMNDINEKIQMGARESALENVRATENVLSNFVKKAPKGLQSLLVKSMKGFSNDIVSMKRTIKSMPDLEIEKRQLIFLTYYNQKIKEYNRACKAKHPVFGERIQELRTSTSNHLIMLPTILNSKERQFASEAILGRLAIVSELCRDSI